MTVLERRYRRLLARWYPAEHRALHEEEMIAVLLAGAEPGRDRPGMRDTFDLVRGGLAIRVRRGAGSHWREAVNVAALVAPVALLLAALARAVLYGALASQGSFVEEELRQLLELVSYALPYALVVWLSWRGRRGAAAACAWAYALVIAWTVVQRELTWSSTYYVVNDGIVLIGGVPVDFGGLAMSVLSPILCGTMSFLAPSPGPGSLGSRRLLGWMGVVFGASLVGALISPRWAYPSMWALAMVAAVPALRSPVGRRALVVLGVTTWLVRNAGKGTGGAPASPVGG
ncbi:hypothetical protein [Nonomuraea sp. SBT364]|uniref:hypothetical protein n=1 Tax=Nonomuraea sp. SBT364 TaxID=1580530 RepID=UPI00066AAD1E|nr:hypothetical protein [Nonomuraea sp. SBT364]